LEQIKRSLRPWNGPLRYINGIADSLGHPDTEYRVKITVECEARHLPVSIEPNVEDNG